MRLALIFGLGFLIAAQVAFAAEQRADQRFEFDIPGQPPGLVLSAYGYATLSPASEGLAISSSPPLALQRPVILLLTSEGRSAEYCSEAQAAIRHAEGGRGSVR